MPHSVPPKELYVAFWRTIKLRKESKYPRYWFHSLELISSHMLLKMCPRLS